MRKVAFPIYVLFVVFFSACLDNEPLEAEFKDINKYSIYDYLEENKSEYSSFISILEKGGIYKTLSAKNPVAAGYSLFLPNNSAIDEFIKGSQFSSLNDLLNDQEYVSILSRYHVITKGIHTNEFPFGAFPDKTLSGDFLTVNFIIESDTAYYKINNQAAVIKPNIEVSNGFIHAVKNVLQPVVYTTYQWLAQNPECTLFKKAVDLTGTGPIIDLNLKLPEQQFLPPVTLLVEPDRIFRKMGVNTIEDLIQRISPGNSNYTDPSNPLYNFVAYHVLKNSYFIDDFEGTSTNYNTFSEVPLLIDGLGNDIGINKGKRILETVITGTDTTYIDFIGLLYDESNILTQSGSIHFIDRVLQLESPSRSQVDFQFREEPIINTLRNTLGTFLLDDYKDKMNRLNWTGAELFFIKESTESTASNDDYLLIDGDFSIQYTIPQVVQGRYNLILRAESFSRRNALVEVYLDGRKIGSTVDLTSGGTTASPYRNVTLGAINFNRYTEHVIEIRAMIPGRFLWDYIRFTPI
jgi:uncharacterized surface protein with fasciclin (FAS1) repeats